MQADPNRQATIKRILSRLPPERNVENTQQLSNALGGEEIQTVSLDFKILTDGNANKFIGTPYTSSESHDNSFRYASV